MSASAVLDDTREKLHRLRRNVESVFFGKSETVTEALIGLLSRGHILIDDVPGVGKTVLARALARSIGCSFSRLQLTPDLLPSDILGVSIYNERSGEFEFKRGPIFANIILADEINRTTPRTQSALLEAMNEAQVSVDGDSIQLEPPFLVIATQNPFDFEGTYALPENQLDRFMLRIRIGYPAREHEERILRERSGHMHLNGLDPVLHTADVLALQEAAALVRVDDRIVSYILDLVEATRKHDQLRVGISPRGALALRCAAQAAALLADRDYVIPDDVKALVIPVFAHRLGANTHLHNGQARGIESLLSDLLTSIPVPG